MVAMLKVMTLFIVAVYQPSTHRCVSVCVCVCVCVLCAVCVCVCLYVCKHDNSKNNELINLKI